MDLDDLLNGNDLPRIQNNVAKQLLLCSVGLVQIVGAVDCSRLFIARFVLNRCLADSADTYSDPLSEISRELFVRPQKSSKVPSKTIKEEKFKLFLVCGL